MRNFSLAVVSILLLAPLDSDSDQASDSNRVRSFGADVTLERATPLAEILKSPERFGNEPVLVRGTISDVCQRKGCWTIVRDGDAHVRVRFKDYGFFVPKDCTGEKALVQGVVKLETLSEEAARHYESESRAGDPSRVSGPRREVGLVASGVRLLGRDQAAH